MNKKKMTILVCTLFMVFSLGACGKTKEDEFAVTQQESSPQVVESIEEELTSEELLDLFISGSIDAVDSKDTTSKFNIADFNIGSGEGDSYSIGEKIDLDNDGENELIICGTSSRNVYQTGEDSRLISNRIFLK